MQVLARYEKLRLAALGELLPPEERSGLGLFLRQGMWAWVRTLSADKARKNTTCPHSSTSIASHRHEAVIQIFAAMVLNTNYRRAQ
ncbi:MAG: hypothetical protein HQM09_24290 [Candidatus Riflebacteria bacterium]|nr:hypothetical protein [Candidatus Riflebacteria bacterium]